MGVRVRVRVRIRHRLVGSQLLVQAFTWQDRGGLGLGFRVRVGVRVLEG